MALDPLSPNALPTVRTLMPNNWNWHQRWKRRHMTLRMKEWHIRWDQISMGSIKIVMIMLTLVPRWKVNTVIFHHYRNRNTWQDKWTLQQAFKVLPPSLCTDIKETEFSGRKLLELIYLTKKKNMRENDKTEI